MSALPDLVVWSIVLAMGCLSAPRRANPRRLIVVGTGLVPAVADRGRAARSPLRPRPRSPGVAEGRDPDPSADRRRARPVVLGADGERSP